MSAARPAFGTMRFAPGKSSRVPGRTLGAAAETLRKPRGAGNRFVLRPAMEETSGGRKRSPGCVQNDSLKSAQLLAFCSAFFVPKSAAPIPADRGTASMTPMELATAEISSTAK